MADGSVPTPWLQCLAVRKHYGGIVALADATIDLYPGEVHGLVGPNGAGKSTLMKILAGVVDRDGGDILIDGLAEESRDPGQASRHGLVLMPQEITILPDSSVIDNVTLGGEVARHGIRAPRECRAITTRALETVGLDVDPNAYAGDLSAAQQRLLMLAHALTGHARLLILDEPTAGLPPREAHLVTQAVRRLMGQDITIVYVSHNLTEVAALSDRVSCVREGVVVKTLTGAQITHDELVSMLLDNPSGTPAPSHGAPRAQHESLGTATSPPIDLRDVSGQRLKNVSLTAVPGQVTGITGLLGSGVQEIVSILVGAARPRSGTLSVDDRQLSLHSPSAALAHGIGYVAGDRAQVGILSMSIKENVSLSALGMWLGRLGLLRPRDERSRVEKILAELSVRGDIDRPLSALSGGNQQRALVARPLAANLRIIVLDEPTVGVDIRARRDLWETLRGLAHERTVIVASSEPEELVAVADRVICVRAGRIATILEGDDINERSITRAIT